MNNSILLILEHRPHGRGEFPVLPRSDSTSEFQPLEDKSVEYFFASDASAIIEHTNRVIYFEVISYTISITGFFYLLRL